MAISCSIPQETKILNLPVLLPSDARASPRSGAPPTGGEEQANSPAFAKGWWCGLPVPGWVAPAEGAQPYMKYTIQFAQVRIHTTSAKIQYLDGMCVCVCVCVCVMFICEFGNCTIRLSTYSRVGHRGNALRCAVAAASA